MAKSKTTSQPKPIHLLWYLFGEEKTPRKIAEGITPEYPFKSFDTLGEAMGHLMIKEGYCTASKNIKEEGCPKRFNCQLYSNFFKLAGTGKFVKQYMSDIFKYAPWVEKDKEVICNSFIQK